MNEPASSARTVAAIEEHLARGDRAEAVRTVMRELVLMPEDDITYLESLPSWPARLAAAHTLPRELGVDLVMDPADLRQIAVAVLTLLGGDSPEGPRSAARLLASTVPRHRRVVLEGQQHVADQLIPEDFARHVLDFLADDGP